MKTKLLSSIAIILFATGCLSYGGNTRSDFSPFKEVICDEKSDELYLFMENEKVDFEYERIGLMEIQGGQFSSLNEVMNELKRTAWENCANAIINVSQSNATRESGTAFVEESEEQYTSKILTGMAIRVDLSKSFKADHVSKAVSLGFLE
ncbi:MAG: hypothetical protein ABJG47_10230 [Ekhidna sp.]